MNWEAKHFPFFIGVFTLEYKEHRRRLLRLRPDIGKLRKIRARRPHTCQGCGRAMGKGEEYWGYHDRYAIHKCGPGSKKGHRAWEFVDIHMCNTCYEESQRITPDPDAPFIEVCSGCLDLVERSKLWNAVECHDNYPPVCPHLGEPELGWDHRGDCQICGRTAVRVTRLCLLREIMSEEEFSREVERLKAKAK
jgi:hypothetical protein